jgi:hypothetical protein
VPRTCRELVRDTPGSTVYPVCGPRTCPPNQNPWTVYLVTITDGRGLARQYEEEDLDHRGFGHLFTVVGPVERVGPLLEGLAVTPAVIDARHGPARLTTSARATDDVSGVSKIAVSVSSRTSGMTKVIQLQRVGSSTDWSGTVSFGEWDTPGRWEVALVVLEDRASWELRLDRGEMSALHLSTMFSVRSNKDRARPALLTSSVSPLTVDARIGDGVVTLQARVSDARSGVARVRVDLPSRPTSRTPWRTQFVKVSGSARLGVWRARAYFPHCDARNGRHTVQIRVTDRAGNSRRFSSPEFNVTSNNTEGPELKMVSYKTQPRSGPVVFVWHDDVTGIRDENALVRPYGYDRFDADEPPAAIPGSWRCRNVRSAHVSCATGQVRTAQFTPDVPLPGKSRFLVDFNPEHTMSVMSFTGHPEIQSEFTTRRGPSGISR